MTIKDCPNAETFARFAKMSPEALEAWGLTSWSVDHFGHPSSDTIPDYVPVGTVIWLLPGKWIAAIPRGFVLVTISGRRFAFDPDHADTDTRFGYLSYGIVRDL